MKYYTIDEDWNICVVKPRKVWEDSEQTEYQIMEVKIPYKTIVTQYGMSFEFLMDLQLIAQNRHYLKGVMKLANEDSKIDLTIFDNFEIYTYDYTYTATRHTREIDTLPQQGEGVGGIRGYKYSEGPIEDKKLTVTQNDTVKANVTKAKTWIIEQETNYIYEVVVTKDDTTKNNPPDEGDPGGVGQWDTNREEIIHEKMEEKRWMKQETIGEAAPSEFMGLWQNDTGKYYRGAKYVSKSENGKIIKYPSQSNVDVGVETDTVITNFLTGEDYLYKLLERKPITQFNAEVMKYIIKLYRTGQPIDQYEGIKIDGSVFQPLEFIEETYIGDGIDVHDESLFITDLETLKKAFRGYSGSEKLIANAQAFLDMQEKYKVNAIFAAVVSIIETSGGRAGHAVDGHNNWFNIRGISTKWARYDSNRDGIMAFGNLIANGSYYYKKGNFTVGAIGHIYCPNQPPDYPTQGDKWVANVTAQMSQFYATIGMDISPYITPEGGTIEPTEGDYRKVYKTAEGRSYIEYYQDGDSWEKMNWARR